MVNAKGDGILGMVIGQTLATVPPEFPYPPRKLSIKPRSNTAGTISIEEWEQLTENLKPSWSRQLAMIGPRELRKVLEQYQASR